MRIIGLDIGSKTIGVALSDPCRIVSQPFSVIKRTDIRHDIDQVSKIVHDKEVSLIVVGLPLRTDGTRGESAVKTIEFVKRLKRRISVPVVTWDERYSTVAAERILITADLSRQKRKGVIDSVAAAIILDGYLHYLRQQHSTSSGCESKDFSMENIAMDNASEDEFRTKE
ncbi:MAG: Holliday junction resolvase RuvX [Firmicutes bacterium]|nr:Holliday junction resolvase RuvX [Bacillota bacterium]